MGTAIQHPVPDRVKSLFVIFDIRALWRSMLSRKTDGISTVLPLLSQLIYNYKFFYNDQ